MPFEQFSLTMPQYPGGREKNIRVWTPGGYDPADTSKRYPVLYMHDGQNLAEPSPVSGISWGVDKAFAKMAAEGKGEAIVVGIDSGEDRIDELCPPWAWDAEAVARAAEKVRGIVSDAPETLAPFGDKTAEFMVSTLKRHIDKHYSTKPDRANTGVGGSSMGGLHALYMGLSYRYVYGFSIALSPALALLGKRNLHTAFGKSNLSTAKVLPRLYLYSGGADPLEKLIETECRFAAQELVKLGYPKEKLEARFEEELGHDEAAWAEVFPGAYEWTMTINN